MTITQAKQVSDPGFMSVFEAAADRDERRGPQKPALRRLPFFLAFLRLPVGPAHHHAVEAGRDFRPGRRTARTFPLFPPPQKN
jgi:hypothetical protein